jgi:hypothetical protein
MIWHKKYYFLGVASLCVLIYQVFQMKYNVQFLEREKIKCQKELNQTMENINLLKIEWERLISPKRLIVYAKKYCPSFKPSTPKHVIDLSQIPLTVPNPDKQTSPIIHPKKDLTLDDILNEES